MTVNRPFRVKPGISKIRQAEIRGKAKAKNQRGKLLDPLKDDSYKPIGDPGNGHFMRERHLPE